MNNFTGWRAFRIVALVVVLVGLVALVVVRRPETAERSTSGPSAVSVQAVPVVRGPLRSVLTSTAAIEASQQVMVAPRVAAQIFAIHVDVGATVKAGDALATLDPGTLPQQVQQARAAVLSAQAQLGNAEGGGSTAGLAAASAALLAALNQQSAAQQALDALQGRADSSTAAAAAQAESDRMRAQQTKARTDLDAALASSGAASGFGATAVRSSLASLDSAVSARCTQIGNREPCTVIALRATAGGGLGALVRALNSGTPAIPTDFLPILTQFETDASALNAPAVSDAAFRIVQASAALPGLAARANNSTFSLGAGGNPTAEALANAIRARDAADAAVTAAREQQKLLTQPETAGVLGARAAQAGAAAGLAVAEASLEQTIVRAPFDGVIADRMLDVGAYASPLTPMFVLVTRAIELKLAVDEARIASVRIGQPAEITVSAYPGRTFAAKVAVIAPIGDARTHTFDVRVLADDAGGLLRPGMLAELRLVTGEQADALLVPTGAIITQGQGPVVFTVRDGKVTLRRIRLGGSDGRLTAILDGVNVGDQVVIGQSALRDGQSVTVRAPAATPAASPTATPVQGR